MLMLFIMRELCHRDHRYHHTHCTDSASGQEHGLYTGMVQDNTAYQVRENAAYGDGAGDEGLAFYLVQFLHGLADVICACGDEHRIGEELEALADIHMRHALCEYQYQYLNEKCDAGNDKEFLRRYLFEHYAYQCHDGKLQYSLEEVGIAQLRFVAAQVPYYLYHEVIDHVVREIKAYRSDQEKCEGRIAADEMYKAVVCFDRSTFAFVFLTALRLSEDQYYQDGKHHGDDIYPQQYAHTVLLNYASYDHGSDRKAGGAKTSGQSVIDTTAGFLVFKAQRRHNRLVSKLYHVDDDIYREDDQLVILREHKYQRTRQYYQHGDHYKTTVGKPAGLIDDTGYNRLQHCG